MPNEPYTNRELDAKFKEQTEVLQYEIRAAISLIQSVRTEQLIPIKEQTIKTNGRVTALEIENSNRLGANNMLKFISATAIALLVGYLAWIGNQVGDINKILAQYEVIISP